MCSISSTGCVVCVLRCAAVGRCFQPNCGVDFSIYWPRPGGGVGRSHPGPWDECAEQWSCDGSVGSIHDMAFPSSTGGDWRELYRAACDVSFLFSFLSPPLCLGYFRWLTKVSSQNMGGIVPRYFVMAAMDMYTVQDCGERPGGSIGHDGHGLREDCTTVADGFYIVNGACILVGVMMFVLFLRPALRWLQRVPLEAWRVDL